MMQRLFFIIILLVFLGLMFLTNRYVVSRGVWALEHTNYQQLFKIVFWALPILFFVGQMLERLQPIFMTKVITSIGSVWLGWFLYALLVVVLIDLLRLFGKWFNWHWLTGLNKLMVFAVVFIGLLALVVYSIINANMPIVKQHQIKINKALDKPIKIAMASDLHIGAIHSRKSIERLVKMINAEKPDVVLVAGDLVDHNPRFGIQDRAGEPFKKLQVPMGILASTGNHEYLGHAEMSIEYLSRCGIRYLRDEYIEIDNRLIIAGREDREMQRLNGKKRLPINTILANANQDLPIILIDHQPVEYDKAIAEGVDLMLSGHTHKGQLWPLNYITNMVFENHYGLIQKAQTWFYTSNGYGTWGPPMRVGNRPEVVVIEISGKID